MSFVSLIKPPMWGLSPGLVSPEWHWVFSSVDLATPMWGPGTLFQDFGNNRLNFDHGGTDPAVWNATTRGLAAQFDNPESNTAEDFYDASPTFVPNYSGGAVTALALVDVNWSTNSNRYAHALASGQTFGSSTNLAFGIRDSTTANARMVFLFTRSSGAALSGAQSIRADLLVGEGTPSVICGRWTTGSAAELFINGVGIANETSFGTTIHGDGSVNLRVGSGTSMSSSSAGFRTGWHIHGAYLFPYALADNQIIQLSRDFFGPFRMADEARVVYDLAAAVEVDVLGPYGQQQPVIEVVEVVGY